MSQICCGGSNGQLTRRSAVGLKAADGLALAASPTFAIMALLTGVLGADPAEMLCSAAHVSPRGMVTMYLLMSAFHAAPWLKLISERPPALTNAFRLALSAASCVQRAITSLMKSRPALSRGQV